MKLVYGTDYNISWWLLQHLIAGLRETRKGADTNWDSQIWSGNRWFLSCGIWRSIIGSVTSRIWKECWQSFTQQCTVTPQKTETLKWTTVKISNSKGVAMRPIHTPLSGADILPLPSVGHLCCWHATVALSESAVQSWCSGCHADPQFLDSCWNGAFPVLPCHQCRPPHSSADPMLPTTIYPLLQLQIMHIVRFGGPLGMTPCRLVIMYWRHCSPTRPQSDLSVLHTFVLLNDTVKCQDVLR